MSAATSDLYGDVVLERLELVRNWLLERRSGLAEIDLDLDLIDARVLDSLGFLNFVNYLQEVTDRELHVDAQSANTFRTLRSICDNILAD